jgi:hypothetical protein
VFSREPEQRRQAVIVIIIMIITGQVSYKLGQAGDERSQQNTNAVQ